MGTGGTGDDGAMPSGRWPPPSIPPGPDPGPAPRIPHVPSQPPTQPPPPPRIPPPPMMPPPSVGPVPRSPSEWKRPPLGAPLGVWIGVGLFLAVPALVVVALVVFIEPTSDAAFMTFEEDETGFFPFLAALFSVLLLIVAIVGVGVALLVIAVAIMVISGFVRRKR